MRWRRRWPRASCPAKRRSAWRSSTCRTASTCGNWNPDYEGELGELPRILKPLEPFKEDILLLGNLTHNSGRALLDGAGDHGRCCGSYLTGVQPRKTMVDIKAGISCDQIVANQIGSQTRFPSLEVGLEDARQAGDCDSGYSCAYTNNLAWRSETQPLPPILDPRALFERLFGSGRWLNAGSARAPEQVPPQHSRFRQRRHAEAADESRPDRPAQARRVSLLDSRNRDARSRKPRRTTRRSIRAWRSRTAFRPISPSTSS